MGSIRTTVFTSSTSVSVARRHLLGSAAGSSLMAAWSRKLQYQIKTRGKTKPSAAAVRFFFIFFKKEIQATTFNQKLKG
jgi:hypothetical protein